MQVFCIATVMLNGPSLLCDQGNIQFHFCELFHTMHVNKNHRYTYMNKMNQGTAVIIPTPDDPAKICSWPVIKGLMIPVMYYFIF